MLSSLSVVFSRPNACSLFSFPRAVLNGCLISLVALSGVCIAQNDTPPVKQDSVEKKVEISLDELLDQVKLGRKQDAADNQKRLSSFRADKASQQALYAKAEAEEKAQEAISAQQEQTFEENELRLTDLQQRLDERLGALRELFGVLQQVSGDAEANFSNSITQIDFPQRTEFLNTFTKKMGQTNELPSISEIEGLWQELEREMLESGKIVSNKHKVINREGKEVEKDVTRVGTFNLVADGRYLQFIPETGRILEYARQPSSRYLNGAEELSEGSTDIIPFTIDPARGQLLALIVQAPKLTERISQGGIIGYIIIALGLLTMIVAVIRYIMLVMTKFKIDRQLAHPENIQTGNPLGRVLKEYQSNKSRNFDTIELKMGEAVLREVPKVQRGLSFLKIIAAVAPLMGLLGTVTGMIVTFQTITLFGAGDPKLMAGGISQALVTTVLGLCVAIPTLLLHNLLQTKAKTITDILEQEAVGLVAEVSPNKDALQAKA